MREFIEEHVADQEAFLDHTLSQRLSRVLIVAFVGTVASWAAQKAYDRYTGFDDNT